jgi:hypothetical protein
MLRLMFKLASGGRKCLRQRRSIQGSRQMLGRCISRETCGRLSLAEMMIAADPTGSGYRGLESFQIRGKDEFVC